MAEQLSKDRIESMRGDIWHTADDAGQVRCESESEAHALLDMALRAAQPVSEPVALQEIMFAVFAYAALHHEFRAFDGLPETPERTAARNKMLGQDAILRAMLKPFYTSPPTREQTIAEKDAPFVLRAKELMASIVYRTNGASSAVEKSIHDECLRLLHDLDSAHTLRALSPTDERDCVMIERETLRQLLCFIPDMPMWHDKQCPGWDDSSRCTCGIAPRDLRAKIEAMLAGRTT